MNARINLLPHREERRKRARQHFAVSGGTAIVGIALAFLMYQYYERQISTQSDRNNFLATEITKLDKEIAEINNLNNQIQALLARKQVIETLQADRAQTVHLLEQLVRQMPDGVYLKSMKQTGQKVHLVGYAQSNARVSTLMRNIEAVPGSSSRCWSRSSRPPGRQEARVRIQHVPATQARRREGRRQGAGDATAAQEGLSHGIQLQAARGGIQAHQLEGSGHLACGAEDPGAARDPGRHPARRVFRRSARARSRSSSGASRRK